MHMSDPEERQWVRDRIEGKGEIKFYRKWKESNIQQTS